MENKNDQAVYSTAIGKLLIQSNEAGITSIDLSLSPPSIQNPSPLTDRAAQELNEYFSGKRTHFTLPLAPKGTVFQKKVWDALRTIPYDQTRSYKQIAEQVGCPNGYRAVGGANHNNPILILIPCHRVIGADGSMTGFGAGMDLKVKLLSLEQNANKSLF